MNNDLMLVSRAQLERIQVQLNNAATAFKGAKSERDALRTLLAAPAAQAADEDKLRDLASSAFEMAMANGVNEHAFMMLARSVAALAAPVQHSGCDRCGAPAVDACTGNGCAYLESGNGAPVQSVQAPVTGHAIPQWLRDQFDHIELNINDMRAPGVFTQMRTKVQAYFEIRRSIERGQAGRKLYEALANGAVARVNVERPGNIEWLVHPAPANATELYAAPVRAVRLPERYTCIGKGGEYELVGLANGAGTIRGIPHMVYKNADGVLFVRDASDFNERMQRIDAAAQLNAQPAGPES